MDDISSLVREVLEKGFVMSLATTDKAGIWVSALHYVNDEFDIYWSSDVNSRHSKAILKNPNVAATIILSNSPNEKNLGLQIEGTAEKIYGDVFPMAVKIRLKNGKNPPTKEGEFLDPEESWYKLKSKKIELTHAALFGFEKKILELK